METFQNNNTIKLVYKGQQKIKKEDPKVNEVEHGYVGLLSLWWHLFAAARYYHTLLLLHTRKTSN